MDHLAFLRLLDDERVAQEIERYKWIESEKLGCDIGKERAALEWIRAFGRIWLKLHKPDAYKALLTATAQNAAEDAYPLELTVK